MLSLIISGSNTFRPLGRSGSPLLCQGLTLCSSSIALYLLIQSTVESDNAVAMPWHTMIFLTQMQSCSVLLGSAKAVSHCLKGIYSRLVLRQTLHSILSQHRFPLSETQGRLGQRKSIAVIVWPDLRPLQWECINQPLATVSLCV